MYETAQIAILLGVAVEGIALVIPHRAASMALAASGFFICSCGMLYTMVLKLVL